jgi:hypothetical protein
MDTTKPYMRIERGKTGETAAIRLVMPGGSSVDVVITRNEKKQPRSITSVNSFRTA